MKIMISFRIKTVLYIIAIAALSFVFLYPRVSREGLEKIVMGGQFQRQPVELCEDQEVTKEIQEKSKADTYFRPSKLPSLNTTRFNSDFWWSFNDKKPSSITLSKELLKSPEDTILNYFSLLRHAENLTSEKSGGCGTVGDSRLPYPVAYSFFTSQYKKKVSYDNYLKSFEGIGHTNLIKLKKVSKDNSRPNNLRYFIEIETIEGSDKGVTYFVYYYGFVYIAKSGDTYKISDIEFFGEDFLCAPYHGWSHNAESSVDIRYGQWMDMIAERYPTKQEGYVKNIYFKGKDGNDYYIVFFQLTNDTDIEIEQYKKVPGGKWELIGLDPESHLPKNES